MSTFWQQIAKFILRNRLGLLVLLILLTGVMLFFGKDIQMSYNFARIIPEDNIKNIELNQFRTTFGDDANILIVGFKDDRLFKDLEMFNDWYLAGDSINAIEGVDGILSVPHAFEVVKNKEEKKFEVQRLIHGPLPDQAALDSFHRKFASLPFYEGRIQSTDSNVSLMAITIRSSILNSKDRVGLVNHIDKHLDDFAAKHHVEMHKSGLPYFRTYTVTTIANEFKVFLVVALLFTAVILFILFRSFYPVIFSMVVVLTGVIWSLGLVVILGYKVTLLTGLVPALIVVIGIPNCVYLLNKYHAEFKKHGNKIKALSRVIERIGHVTLFTNLTTATGFGVFYFTNSKVLVEFGAVAGICIALLFVISLVIIPVVFSYLPDPNTKHTGYLDHRWLNWIIEALDVVAHNHRKKIYAAAGLLVVIAVGGIIQLQAKGFMLDDIPKDSKIYTDLKFFERNFNGVLPFEVMIDAKKRKKAIQLSFLQKVDKVQEELAKFPELSKPLSLAEGTKFATQAFYNGNSDKYRLPDNYDKNFILSYLKNSDFGNTEGHHAETMAVEGVDMKPVPGGFAIVPQTKEVHFSRRLTESFIDSNQQVARISLNMADIGSNQMPLLLDSISSQVSTVIDTSEYTVTYTGTSLVALAGYRYLINGLINSVSIAFLLIALIMAYLFRSFRMLIISLLPNTIPLILTAGIMGYFDIPLKPSTVLTFSIAFGISVDDTIHFLAKYRQELWRHSWNISKTVSVSLRETGISMIYTSLILFCGFITFTFSSFEGTVYLGMLTSIALIVAVVTNLLLLPCLLLSFERYVDRKAIKKETLLDVFDEEEDIELEKLDIRR